MAHRDAPIAVFDSGVGGISVLRELVRLMPEENYLYFGDSANAPYGSKTTDEVRALTKALVIACNTATAAAITCLRETYPDTIIIGIEPALKVAADRFPTGRIGIMATEVTLREEKLALQLARFPEVTVTRIPAPGLVELIESGCADAPQTEALLRQILAPHVGQLDALVLGCTHYPFVKDTIATIMGNSTVLLDGGEGTARQTCRCLQQAGLLTENGGSMQIENSLCSPEILQLSYALLEMGSTR